MYNRVYPSFTQQKGRKAAKIELLSALFYILQTKSKAYFYNGGFQKMSKIAYVRVSTQEQNEARQREALAARGIDKWFIEKTSAKDTQRPEFQKMMDWVREGDTIYIHDLSRIARSTLDLLHLLNVLAEKDVALVSDKEILTPAPPRAS